MTTDEQVVIDAARWRFTQRRGYFCTGPYDTDGDFCGYTVGAQLDPRTSLNACVMGQGHTLVEALDKAIAKENKG